jgi:hypothetical protein
MRLFVGKRIIQISFCLFLFFHGALYAGTTGKLAGTVTDAETKEPLPAANVYLQGTTLGASTNLDGEYFILNVPPANYTMVVSMMGYREYRLENVRVNLDLVTYNNFEMQKMVLESDEAITVIAKRELVNKSQTSALATVTSEEIREMPIQSVNQVVRLQAGMVDAGGLHLRGGRSGEIASWVDGVPNSTTIEIDVVEEVQVVSGTFNAEYGNAMSGIIKTITKEGGTKYHGHLKYYIGNYFSNKSYHQILNKVNTVYDAQTGTFKAVGESENPLMQLRPRYNIQAMLSGPVPWLEDKVKFITHWRYSTGQGSSFGRRWFTPQGLPGDNELVALNPYEGYSSFNKFTYKIRPEIKLNYSLMWNHNFNERNTGWINRYVPDQSRQSTSNRVVQGVELNHALSARTFYELRISYAYNSYESYMYEDLTRSNKYLVFFPAYGLTLDPEDPIENTMIEQLKDENAQYDYIVDPNGPFGYMDPDVVNEEVVSYSFNRIGTSNNYDKNKDIDFIGKLDVTSQISAQHEIKAGAEYFYTHRFRHHISLRPAEDENGSIIEPYYPSIKPLSSEYHDKYARYPNQFALYIQDKMDFQKVIINLGLRFDYFNANSVIPADPTDPNIYDPMQEKYIYKNWIPAPDSIAADVNKYEAYKSQFEKYTPDERRAFMHKKVDPKVQLSPRLGIAYPISSRGVIHFSYGHFFQIPSYGYLYGTPDFKIISSKGGYDLIGNADLNAERSVMYEIGLKQQVAEDVGIDVTLFYRDIRDWVGASPYINTANTTVFYSKWENKDYANSYGLTFELVKRLTNDWQARINYSYMLVEGTYSSPSEAYAAVQDLQREPRKKLIPLNYDQRHTLNATVSVRTYGWLVSAIGEFKTGLPYTPSHYTAAELTGASAFTGWTQNSERKPKISSVTLRLQRDFSIFGLANTIAIYVYNLFDQRGMVNIFSDTGTATYTSQPDINKTSYNPNRIGTIEHYVQDRAHYYQSPREIRIEHTIAF